MVELHREANFASQVDINLIVAFFKYKPCSGGLKQILNLIIVGVWFIEYMAFLKTLDCIGKT